MKHFAAISIFLAAASLGANSPAQSQPAPTRNPNIIVDYIEPRPPIDPQDKDFAKDTAEYQRQMHIYQRFKQRQVLEELSAFLAPLRFPHLLRVRTKPCGVINAFYDPTEWTVNICYEWIDATELFAPKGTSPEGFTRQEVLVGSFVGVVLHEMGHAVNDMFTLPVLGREEDAADQIAGFVMLQFGKEVARTAIKGMAYVWLTFARASYPAYWDVHSTPGQRFYNFLCIGYGGDPQTFKDQVDKWLSKDRVETCAHEYQQVRNAFAKTVLPHIDQDLLKQVQSRQWLRPEDGKLE
jgi:Putative metallopeptidase